MASEAFTIWESVTFSGTAGSNGLMELAVSDLEQNQNDYEGLRVVIEYEDVQPASAIRDFELLAVVETNDGTIQNPIWTTVMNQGEPFQRDGRGKTRILIMQPNIINFDLGVDEIFFDGVQTVSRKTRTQGKLGADFRVRLLLNEKDAGGPGAFQRATISVHGERYNA